MRYKTVYILIYDHQYEIYQQVLGVFTTPKKAEKAQSYIPTSPTTVHKAIYEYDDPPYNDEYVWVETRAISNITIPLRATNIFDTQFIHRTQNSFINPAKRYIIEYARILSTETEMLEGLLASQDQIPNFNKTEIATIEESFDLGDDNMETLRELLTDF